MVKNIEIAILTYNMYENENEEGWPYHGLCDTLPEARSMHKLRLSRDIVSHVESCLKREVLIDLVKMHIKKHLDMDATTQDRDFLLYKKEVVNMYNHLRKGNYFPQ